MNFYFRAILLSLAITINVDALERVTLQLKWKYQFQFAGFIIAKEKGFYKDEGIDIELLEHTSHTDTLWDLERGNTLFALSDSSVILEVARGKRLVGLMAIYQNSPYILMSLKSSNLKSLADINYKRVALYDDMNGRALDLVLKMNNIHIHKVPITNQFTQLQTKKSDFAVGYLSNEPYLAKEMGIDLNILDLKDYGFNRYGDILFTLEDTLKKRPELVAKMYRATKKGFEYAFSNIDEVIDIIYEKYNTQNKSKEAYAYEAKMLKGLVGESEEFGRLDPAKIDSIGYLYSYLDSKKYNQENLKDFIYKPYTSKDFRLTDEEKTYLKDKKSINMCYSKNSPPFTMMEYGQPVGMVIDFLRLIEKRIGVPFKFIYADNTKEQFAMLKKGVCSSVPLILTSPQTIPFVVATKPMLEDTMTLVTRIDEPYIFDIEMIKNRKIGISRHAKNVKKFIKSNYPYINIVDLDNRDIDKVADGDIYGLIGPSIKMNYLISLKYKDTLKVMRTLKSGNIEGSMGVRISEPMLLSILDKAIMSFGREKKDEIYNKWINVKYKETINYQLIYQIIFVALLILSGTIYWNRRLNAEVNRRKDAEEELREVNINLETRVKEAIEEVHHKELLLQNQSRLAQMGEMIAMIAHQWRQPLSAITSAIINIDIKQNFKCKDLDNRANIESFLEYNNKKLNQIEGYVSFLSETIDNFRDFFNLDKEQTECYINKTIDVALNIISSSFENKQIDIIKDLDIDTKVTIYQNEIIQVILNILVNAKDNFEQSDIKKPQIIISTSTVYDTIYISIYDNGGGVREDILDSIFDPYFSTKNIKNGSGLGLYMSRIIVEEHHGGQLNVNNILDGVIFDIILPLR